MEKNIILTSAEFAKRVLKIKMLQFCTTLKCFWISIPKTIIFSQNQWNEKKKRTKLHRELD